MRQHLLLSSFDVWNIVRHLSKVISYSFLQTVMAANEKVITWSPRWCHDNKKMAKEPSRVCNLILAAIPGGWPRAFAKRRLKIPPRLLRRKFSWQKATKVPSLGLRQYALHNQKGHYFKTSVWKHYTLKLVNKYMQSELFHLFLHMMRFSFLVMKSERREYCFLLRENKDSLNKFWNVLY